MKSILIFLLAVTILPNLALAAPSDRLRERQLRLISRCETYIEAVSAARPQTFESRLNRFHEEHSEDRDQWDYYWKSSARKPKDRDPVCDGDVLARGKPRFPIMCGSTHCARMLPHACMFVEFGIDERGATTKVDTLRRFPDGDSKALRSFESRAEDAVNKWCFPVNDAPEFIDPERGNVSLLRYAVLVDEIDWEQPSNQKEVDRLAEFYQPISRAACKDFWNDYDELGGAQRTPAAANDSEVINAAPRSRILPEWPETGESRYFDHACVVARFSVNEDGSVSDIETLFSAPTRFDMTGFEAAVSSTMRTWKYDAALRNDQPVKQSNLLTTIQFMAGE